MRKILLQEETPVFDIPDFKKVEKKGRDAIPPEFKNKDQEVFNDYARKVPELATEIKQFSDAVQDFEKYAKRNSLKDSDFRRMKDAATKLSGLEKKMGKAVAFYQKRKVESRPEKYRKENEEKSKKEPTSKERLDKIKNTPLEKVGHPEESYNWKDRVRFFLLGEAGASQPSYNSGYPKNSSQPIAPMGMVGAKGKMGKTSPNYSGDRPAYNSGYPKELSGEKIPNQNMRKGKKKR